MKLFNKLSASALGLVLLLALAPGTAMARGGLYLDLPGLSIGVHNSHGSKYRHRKSYRRDYRHNYYDDRYRSRRYDRRRDRQRYYNNGYNDNYYYGGRRSNRYYNYSRPRRVEVCPLAGYSPYYLSDGECTKHKGHYHCNGY